MEMPENRAATPLDWTMRMSTMMGLENDLGSSTPGEAMGWHRERGTKRWTAISITVGRAALVMAAATAVKGSTREECRSYRR